MNCRPALICCFAISAPRRPNRLEACRVIVEANETFHPRAWRREGENGGLALADVFVQHPLLLVAGHVVTSDDIEIGASAGAPTYEQCARLSSAYA